MVHQRIIVLYICTDYSIVQIILTLSFWIWRKLSNYSRVRFTSVLIAYWGFKWFIIVVVQIFHKILWFFHFAKICLQSTELLNFHIVTNVLKLPIRKIRLQNLKYSKGDIYKSLSFKFWIFLNYDWKVSYTEKSVSIKNRWKTFSCYPVNKSLCWILWLGTSLVRSTKLLLSEAKNFCWLNSP